jgi:hypothetical protein
MVQESVPEDYPEISDLLNRYKTLKDANEDLSQRQQDHEEMNEAKRIEFANFQKVGFFCLLHVPLSERPHYMYVGAPERNSQFQQRDRQPAEATRKWRSKKARLAE